MSTTTTLLVTVKNDPVPGTFHTAQSVQEQVQAMLTSMIPHYEPQVDLVDGPMVGDFATGFCATCTALGRTCSDVDCQRDFEKMLLRTTLRQVLEKFRTIMVQVAEIEQERDQTLAEGKPWVPTGAQFDVMEEVGRLAKSEALGQVDL